MTSDESRLEILKRVGDGILSIDEGSELIGILAGVGTKHAASEGIDPPPATDQSTESVSPQVSNWWKAVWSLILVGGAVLTGFSSYWVYQGYQKAGFGWGFWLSWIPFIIGVLIMLLGSTLMDSPWLHLRVNARNSNKPRKISITMPLPLKLASWVFRVFGHYMPAEVKDMRIDEMLNEVENTLKRGEPFQVEVEDKEDGDQVYIYITK